MSRKNQFLITLFFEILGLGLLFYAASRTLNFVQDTMPADKQFMGYLYLLSTGIGSLIWMNVYLKKARGAAQRGIAFGMGILDLLGEFVMVYADTMYVSSQSGKIIMSQEELGLFILASVGIMGINAIAYFSFKLADPEANAEQKAQDLVDDISDAAHKQLNTPEERQKMIADYSPQIRAAVMGKVADAIADAVGRQAQTITIRQNALPASQLHVPEENKPGWLEYIGEKLGVKQAATSPAMYSPAVVGGIACLQCGKPSGDELFCSQNCEIAHTEKTMNAASTRLAALRNATIHQDHPFKINQFETDPLPEVSGTPTPFQQPGE